MRKRKKAHKIRMIFFLLFLIICSVIIFHFMQNDKPIKKQKWLDEISEYNYILRENDTDLTKELFADLKNVLQKDSIDYEKYAECLGKLFIADLYTLDNKLNRYEVTSKNYIYPDSAENFELKVEDTIYRFMPIKENRKDKLAIVKNVEVSNIEQTEFVYNDETFDGYKLNVKWVYEKDLGYDDAGIITLIKKDNKLYIAQYEAEVV